MTKKILATILIVLVLAFATTGCSKQAYPQAPADSTATGEQAAVDLGISEVDTINQDVEDPGLEELDSLGNTLNNW